MRLPERSMFIDCTVTAVLLCDRFMGVALGLFSDPCACLQGMLWMRLVAAAGAIHPLSQSSFLDELSIISNRQSSNHNRTT